MLTHMSKWEKITSEDRRFILEFLQDNTLREYEPATPADFWTGTWEFFDETQGRPRCIEVTIGPYKTRYYEDVHLRPDQVWSGVETMNGEEVAASLITPLLE